jgi:16S rRNA (cytosine967-C5)-methyltransferase
VASAVVAPARAAAFNVLVREAASRAPFELAAAAAAEFGGLEARDRALAYELVMGTIKRRNSLDRVIAAFSTATSSRLRPDVREALRLGAFQLLYLDRVPAHAAVNDAVEQTKSHGRRTGAFVNAVLRRVAAEGRAELARLSAAETTEALALRYSHPDWLVALWVSELGGKAAAALMAADNLPAERCVRVNRLRATPAEAQAALAAGGITARAPAGPGQGRSPDTPDALLLDGAALEASVAFRDGLVTPQSRGSQLAAAIAVAGASGAAGGCAADLCAAPGGKTSQLAALLPGWHVLAVDDEPKRVTALRANLARLGAGDVEVVERDVLTMGADPDQQGCFDLVLLDAPCSGLGTLASRPDLRWRRRAGDVARLAALQGTLLDAAAALVAPGGTLTYSVCTIARAETLEVVERFVSRGTASGTSDSRPALAWALDDLGARHPECRHPGNAAFVQTLPSRDQTTGFFVARLRRVD